MPPTFPRGPSGAAVTDDKYDSFFTGTGVIFNSASETRWGGTVGAGIEFGFAPNLSVGLEYDHLFMGSHSVVFPVSAIAVTRTDTIKQDSTWGRSGSTTRSAARSSPGIDCDSEVSSG
jgi:outer membrane immunogenic protein